MKSDVLTAGIGQASRLLESNKFFHAIALLEQLDMANAPRAEVKKLLAEARARAGDLRGAEGAYRVCTRLEPSNICGWLGLVDVLLDLEELTQSRRVLERAARRFPAEAGIAVRIAFVSTLLGDHARGRAALEASDVGAIDPLELRAVCALLELHDGCTDGHLQEFFGSYEERSMSSLALRCNVLLLLANENVSEAVRLLVANAQQHFQPHSWMRIFRLIGPEQERELTQALLGAAESIGAPALGTFLARRVPVAGSNNDKCVVFVSDTLKARHLKFAVGLTKLGWRTVLLSRVAPSADEAAHFAGVHTYTNTFEALALAYRYPGAVFHLVAGFADEACLLIAKERPGTVVFDPYDIVEGMILDEQVSEHGRLQRMVFDACDGIVGRDTRIRPLFRDFGYRRRPVAIIPDCCWNDEQHSFYHERPSEELHVVSLGYIATAHSPEPDWLYLDLARRMVEAGVHFHHYVHPMQRASREYERIFQDFIRLQRESPYMHLHDPVPPSQLVSSISRYHLGISVSFRLFAHGDHEPYTLSHFARCMSARTSDYLDAGLPVLINKEFVFQRRLLAPFKVTIDLSEEFLRSPGDHIRRVLLNPEHRSRTQRARERCAIPSSVQRLVEFYGAVRREDL